MLELAIAGVPAPLAHEAQIMAHHTPPVNDSGQDSDDGQSRHESKRSRMVDETVYRPGSLDSLLDLSTPIHFTSTPFAWQHGSQLYLLVQDWNVWVLAELRFVPSACHYVEVRRVRYRWPREAIGALLGRALVAGEAKSGQLAAEIATWLATARDRVPFT